MIPLLPATDQPLPCSTNPRLFHAPFGERAKSDAHQERVRQARALCRQCPIATECQDYARTNREAGIWGGESTGDRKARTRKQRLTAAA